MGEQCGCRLLLETYRGCFVSRKELHASMQANNVHFEVKVNIIYNEQGSLYMNNL